jgi:acetyl-CoA carboxylase biotin carboxylase subunit
VLVANRGEIALRVVRTCRDLGIRVSVAHSTADQDSAAVRLADRAICIGPSTSRRSYLNIPAVVEAARAVRADAIHPGYGFLSENADFSEVCANYGISVIGPPPEVLRKLSDKSEARALMAQAGLPLLPGAVAPVVSAREARRLADRIGYPVMLKAVAGGGGRGMQPVWRSEDLEQAFRATAATARAVFADGRLYLERYLASARHVEVQVLCDTQGTAVHLGERDCSVQRSHQKLVEETPAPGLPAGLAGRIGEAAVAGAVAVGYVGAGTFEFLVDPAGDFYFMEVNPRLQVEHPVTEMVTGLDLVSEQLKVASGRALGLSQQDVVRSGVAVECRVNVEDPQRGFLPTPGRLTEFVPPGGPFVRVDTHGHAGYEVPAAYDSLLAKVITWGGNRDQALDRMGRALEEFTVAGPGMTTTISFLSRVLSHPDFRAARHDTRLVEEMTKPQ